MSMKLSNTAFEPQIPQRQPGPESAADFGDGRFVPFRRAACGSWNSGCVDGRHCTRLVAVTGRRKRISPAGAIPGDAASYGGGLEAAWREGRGDQDRAARAEKRKSTGVGIFFPSPVLLVAPRAPRPAAPTQTFRPGPRPRTGSPWSAGAPNPAGSWYPR